MKEAQQSGKVKFFNKTKAYGFITSKSGEDFFFHISDVIGSTMPQKGEKVKFDVVAAKKGDKATHVSILKQVDYQRFELEPGLSRRTIRERDDRVTCEYCGKRIVPRVVFSSGEADHSICPFCGGIVAFFNQPDTSDDGGRLWNILAVLWRVITAVVLLYLLYRTAVPDFSNWFFLWLIALLGLAGDSWERYLLYRLTKW